MKNHVMLSNWNSDALPCQSKARVAKCWKNSPCHKQAMKIDKSLPSKKWINLVKLLTHKQASILMQLQTGYIGLNKHLHHINHVTSPKCLNCDKDSDETVGHYLLACTWYRHDCLLLHRALWHWASELPFLLSHQKATLPLLKFIQATEWFKQTFSSTLLPPPLQAPSPQLWFP